MVKALFIYNPKAGDQGIQAKLDYVFERFQSADIFLIPYRLFQSKEPEKSLLEMIRSEQFSFVIISGGDGSLNYLANLFLRNGISLPIGIFPCGTCNDFARDIGMTMQLDDWIDQILSGKTRCIDAGCVNDHQYFLGNLGGGIFADVASNTQNEFKKSLGPVAYYLKALDELPNIEVFDITVDTEECHLEEKVILFLVLNGRNVAGFSDFYKDADLEDGLIDILLFKMARPMELAGLFIKMLANELPGDPHIIHLRAKEVRIQTDKKIQISVDGEKGTLLPIKVQCIHPGIRLFLQELRGT